jgi:tetratricopeptide (TPR) repeat protein
MSQKHVVTHFFLILTGGIFLLGCQRSDLKLEWRNHYERLYSMGIRYQDPTLKALAAANLYVLDTTQKQWRDSLFLAYREGSALLPLSVLAPELYQEKPKDTLVLETMATLALAKQDLQNAVLYQQKLFELTKNPIYQYQMIVSYTDMGNLEQARKIAEEMLNDSGYANRTIPIQINENQFQNVHIHAAAYNVLGFYAFRQNQFQKAKMYFEKALKIQPDFVLARQGYEFVSRLR